MTSTSKEIRTTADFTLPCPECGTDCQAEELEKPTQRKEVTPAVEVLVLPKRYVYLHCLQCNLQLWAGLDENGNIPD